MSAIFHTLTVQSILVELEGGTLYAVYIYRRVLAIKYCCTYSTELHYSRYYVPWISGDFGFVTFNLTLDSTRDCWWFGLWRHRIR